MRLQFLSLRHALVLFISSWILLASNPAFAAQTVVLKYRILRETMPVAELADFAATGKLSNSLQSNLALAQQDPKVVRRYLTEPVRVNPVIVDKVLNSRIGNPILDQISQVIHTPSGRANRQAMRSALVLSASKDNQISLIEIIQNYPTAEVEVEGDKLESAYKQLSRLQGRLQDLIGFSLVVTT